MSPLKVLECQTDLARRLRSDESMTRLFLKILHKQVSSPGGTRTDQQNRDMAIIAYESLTMAVKHGEAYHVSAEMTQLVVHAASLLDESDVFHSNIAPTANGIVRFDGGLEIIDVSGRPLTVDWIAWRPGFTQGITRDDGPLAGTIYYEFNDIIDNPDEIARELMLKHGYRQVMNRCGRWRLHGFNYGEDGESVGPSMIDVESEYPKFSLHLKMQGQTVAPTTNTKRILLALWMLMGQEVTTTSQPRLHPSIKAAAKREKIAPRVTVVELRHRRERSDAPPSSGRAVDWSHRWYVNGFWRWQPHGTKRSERKRIWIDGYVKGPEDKPLVIKPRVFDLKR